MYPKYLYEMIFLFENGQQSLVSRARENEMHETINEWIKEYVFKQ